MFFIPGNATMQPLIQVRKINKDDQEVLASFERYNFVVGYQVISPGRLELVLKDTIGFWGALPDTVFVIFDDR